MVDQNPEMDLNKRSQEKYVSRQSGGKSNSSTGVWNIYQHDADANNNAVTSPPTLFVCEICYTVDQDNIKNAVSSCKECNELYCDTCTSVHRKQRATKSHSIIEHANLGERSTCEPCEHQDVKGKVANYICLDCDEVQCTECCNVHIKQKATRTHTLNMRIAARTDCDSNIQTKHSGRGSHQPRSSSCSPFPFVKEKMRILRSIDQPVMHYGEDNRIVKLPFRPAKHHAMMASTSSYIVDNYQPYLGTNRKANGKDMEKPGKPQVAGRVLVDSVCLIWEAPHKCYDDYSYQVRFKEDERSAKWTFHPELCSRCSVTLTNLKSHCRYVFQVRMVDDEQEGPYSEISDPIETIQSAAQLFMDFMFDVERPGTSMPLKRLPFQENREARNETGKTRKLIIGNAKRNYNQEKTIMLVGATGTGKSTLVDGMLNYILGVSWGDPYRLTLVDLEKDELCIDENQAVSQTQWITCYTLHPFQGSRLDYTLNIIDTPGFGDTRGIDRDREIMEQIRILFSRDDGKGVLYIDAICFLIKAPDARLTPTQMYIFNAIMSIFGQDIRDNFCMLITFADGKRPPVLSALKEAKLPYEQYFPFNNSGLYAENSGENVSNFSSMFWDMGCKSFQTFFEKLKIMETKSLLQTRNVLEQRRIIEVHMENLLPKLDAGLAKAEELRVEIRIIEDYKTQIEENSDFSYTVTETEQRQQDLPQGKHVTNCLNCHMTCHKNCNIPMDEDKRKCSAMDSEGYCTQCTSKCVWNVHRNTPYIFEYVTVQKVKTYTEKLEKYRRAQDENMTRQKVIERMHEEVFDLEDDILDLMETINNCNNILKQIALRPDPLSVIAHIDLLIESEKLEKRAGYQARIASLQKCRKRATIGDDVDRFMTTTKKITADVKFPQKSKRDRVRRGPFDFFKSVLNSIKY